MDKGVERLSVAEKMQIIKSPKRPVIDDFVQTIFTDFIELHGDRYFGEDQAVCGGIGLLSGIPVTVIGQRRGRTTEENIAANFAMPHPEGYRKALRLARQAEKFGRPVICFVDTPGAFCGIGAEERGQGEAIARNLYEFMSLRIPVISVVAGEGGSGGALALAVANEVYMLENAMYSVISPRGCASILWKDPSRELEAAETLKITAQDLLRFGMIEGIIKEGGNASTLTKNVKASLKESISRLSALSGEELRDKRYEKFRKIGVFNDIND